MPYVTITLLQCPCSVKKAGPVFPAFALSPSSSRVAGSQSRSSPRLTGCRDVRTYSCRTLHQGTVTFSPFTTDIDGDDGMLAELVDGPNPHSSTHLLVILLLAVSAVAAIAVVLAMLDVPFASERAVRTPQPNYPRAAVLGTDLAPPNRQDSDSRLTMDMGPRSPMSVGSSRVFLAHNETTPSEEDSEGSSPSPITITRSSSPSPSVKHRRRTSTVTTVNVTNN
ncbi:hypothetical protein HPB51_013775 [Rhipicephalus microplus]|uniref:Uncharacterized protein n=1 Tax=Rhipicephalus microplus TaxID=6941 RepID=A0A9J6F367_RHIMP|nr:hypothetical protein HPB51_013775 [Rhipicephalus microplus]